MHIDIHNTLCHSPLRLTRMRASVPSSSKCVTCAGTWTCQRLVWGQVIRRYGIVRIYCNPPILEQSPQDQPALYRSYLIQRSCTAGFHYCGCCSQYMQLIGMGMLFVTYLVTIIRYTVYQGRRRRSGCTVLTGPLFITEAFFNYIIVYSCTTSLRVRAQSVMR